MRLRRLAKALSHPHFQRKLHGLSFLFALVTAVPIMVWFRNVIAVMMAITVWTWASGEAAGWLAAMAADSED